MRLAEYLKLENLTAAAFGRRIGASRSVVVRWALGERMPRPEAMQRINKATEGKVSPQDFYSEAA